MHSQAVNKARDARGQGPSRQELLTHTLANEAFTYLGTSLSSSTPFASLHFNHLVWCLRPIQETPATVTAYYP